MSIYPSISKITLPSGSIYELKDEEARVRLDNLTEAFNGAIHYRGQCLTPLEDGSDVNPIELQGTGEYSANPGDLVIYGTTGINSAAPKEFIFNGEVWNEFGSTGSLKSLAFKDSVSASYTPQGEIRTPNFTGVTTVISSTYTPEGIVSAPNFTGTRDTLIITATAGEKTYTPQGVISSPTISVSLNTENVNSIESVGSLPELNMSVTDQVLTIKLDKGTLPTYTTKSFATSVKSASAEAPIFTGTGVRLTSSYTPSGTIDAPYFTGYTRTATAEYTPQGSIGRSTFVGTTDTIISS